jgi:hypothetical protein
MKNVIIFIAILFVFSCGKDEDTISGNTVITGVAFYKNRFAQDSTQLIPYKSGEIFVRYVEDNKDSYFTKLMTDSVGRFYMNLSKLPVILYIKPTVQVNVNTTIPLYGEVTVTAANTSSIHLIASFNADIQNGFLLQVRDDAGGFVTGATAHLYSSEAIANLNNPASAIATLVSNTSGVIFKTNLPAGRYFINTTRTVDTISFQRLLKPVTVAATGFVQDTIILKKTNTTNGFTFTLKDTSGGSIAGADVNLYTSQIAAAGNNPALAIETFLSDKSGKVSKLNLANGTFFVNASKTINNITYQRIGRQFIVSRGVLVDTLLLEPLFLNSLSIAVKDSLGGNISSANVYLFTSEVLAAANDPAAAIESFVTDNNGNFIKENLQPNTYFLNAKKTVGSLIYERLNKRVTVPTSGILADTLILRKK